jgi:2-succinyl-5-enolpyruvyl-6-hydroxy-3-cyclohexene-1-carboxylate synthase
MSKHSAKQTARSLSAALIKAGISDIVISPGSRNAPLIIELTNRQALTNYSIVDERVAGFFALGLSQQSQKPSVLVCTSGSALLNYYPAIAEAFYSHIPLIVVSADRPQKWIDQGEGQTIRQHNVFKNHSWYNVTLSETGVKTDKDKIKKAIETAIDKRGPVHINIPFDEPLYDIVEVPDETVPNIQTNFPDKIYEVPFLESFEQKWQQAKRKMILVGQHQPSELLSLQLKKLAQDPSVIILTENISNVYDDRFVNHIDQVIFPLDTSELQDLKPDILMTIGRNIVSKKVKQFLRQFKPAEHWHIEKTDLPPNTFEALTQHFNTTPEMFLSQFLFLVKPLQEAYYSAKWLNLKQRHFQKHLTFLDQAPYSDLKVFDTITQHIPKDFMVQWGNSSTIRYSQFFGYPETTTHFANRGTSGIDGSGSTAFGAVVQSGKPTLLVSGDISFLYDSNALWHKYIPDNFKIIVINNGGGDIFNFIPGPSNTAPIDEFFVTKHHLHTQHLAEMYRLKYHKVSNLEDLQQILPGFFADNSQ